MLRKDKDKPCRDYQTTDGCRRGSSCKYSHFTGGDGGGGGGGGGDAVRVCRKCGANVNVTGPFHVHKETCPNNNNNNKALLRSIKGGSGSYFLCVRLPGDIDSVLHSFVDSKCMASELLDNHGSTAGSIRMHLHITFTLSIPYDVSSEEEGTVLYCTVPVVLYI